MDARKITLVLIPFQSLDTSEDKNMLLRVEKIRLFAVCENDGFILSELTIHTAFGGGTLTGGSTPMFCIITAVKGN